MARWYKLEKTKPLKFKHGCIEQVLHVWPHQPPSEDELARRMARAFVFLFEEELRNRLAARARERALAIADTDNQSESKPARRSNRKKPGVGKKDDQGG